jgi:glutathione S-transferase
MGAPLLWHLPISHFSEKARWALDWKQIPHRRRIMPPGLHPFGGMLLSRGQVFTMPVLVTEEGPVADSTAILAWLEEEFPDAPPLYPSDPAERERALALEDWFDENVGPHARRWGFNTLLTEPEAVRQFAIKQTEWSRIDVPPVAFAPVAKVFLRMRYATGNEASATASRQKLLDGLDRLEAELDAGSGEFLVGERFTVADLTAAALLYPLVLPPEGPWHPVETAEFRDLQDAVRERPGFRWVEETFRRNRRSSARPAFAAS